MPAGWPAGVNGSGELPRHREGVALLSESSRIGLAGAAVVGIAFGVVRYVYGLTLPGIRADLGLSELVLGLVASATFAGYLAGLLLAGPLASRPPRRSCQACTKPHRVVSSR